MLVALPSWQLVSLLLLSELAFGHWRTDWKLCVLLLLFLLHCSLERLGLRTPFLFLFAAVSVTPSVLQLPSAPQKIKRKGEKGWRLQKSHTGAFSFLETRRDLACLMSCWAIGGQNLGSWPSLMYVYINSGPSRHETESMVRVNDGSLFLTMHDMASSRASSTALTERSVRRHRCSVKVATTLLSVPLTPHFRRAARASFSHAFYPFSSQSVRKKLAQLSLFACGFFWCFIWNQ